MAENKDEIVPNDGSKSSEVTKSRKHKNRTLPLMTDEEYLINRVEDQMNYFNSASSRNKKKYQRYKTMEFAIGATIPVLITFSSACYLGENLFGTGISLSNLLDILAATGGIVLAYMSKKMELFEYFNLWKNYRANAEQLQHEMFLYQTNTRPYDDDNALNTLVENVENFLNQENMKWQSGQPQKKKEEEEEDEEEL